MDDRFEDWARAEVLRLRQEADQLEAFLERFRGSRHGPGPMQTSGVRRNAPLMHALEAAGAGGLTLDQVVAEAMRLGRGRRSTVRSFLWNHVRAGRLAFADGRYVVTAASPPARGTPD